MAAPIMPPPCSAPQHHQQVQLRQRYHSWHAHPRTTPPPCSAPPLLLLLRTSHCSASLGGDGQCRGRTVIRGRRLSHAARFAGHIKCVDSWLRLLEACERLGSFRMVNHDVPTTMQAEKLISMRGEPKLLWDAERLSRIRDVPGYTQYIYFCVNSRLVLSQSNGRCPISTAVYFSIPIQDSEKGIRFHEAASLLPPSTMRG